jgi:hypothetical protein
VDVDVDVGCWMLDDLSAIMENTLLRTVATSTTSTSWAPIVQPAGHDLRLSSSSQASH